MMSIVRRGALLAAAASASTTGTMASDLPVPTPELLNWAQQEIGVIIHYNMETQCTNVSNPQHFCVGVGGSAGGWMPPASFFNPDKLSTDNWLAAAHSLGAKYAVMVAQHCSGFSLWDSSVKAAVDFDYTYNVEHSPFNGSIIKDFIASCAKYGIEPGFYYSLNQNYYLDVAGGKVLNTPKLVPHQVRVNQTTYNKIALEQMRQLWTLFGPIFEVWFDGGDDLPGINSMLESLPNLKHSVHFGGTAKTNNLRWIGTESGHPSAAYPIWSTATDGGVDQHGQKCGPSNLYCGGGSPNGSRWAPAESDTTLQENDAWFYKPGVSIRPLEDMKAVYHDTVGHNSNLLLDIAPDNTGLLQPMAATRMQELGQWIQRCYNSTYVAQVVDSTHNPVKLQVAGQFDRWVLREDQSEGQRIRSFKIEADGVEIGNGTAVGNKLIGLLPKNYSSSTVVLTVTEADGDPTKPVTIKQFGVIDGSGNRC